MNYYTAVSPFWLVAVSVCRRSGLLLIAVSPFWFVAVLVSPFWRVAVLVCRRFDHRPFDAFDGGYNIYMSKTIHFWCRNFFGWRGSFAYLKTGFPMVLVSVSYQ